MPGQSAIQAHQLATQIQEARLRGDHETANRLIQEFNARIHSSVNTSSTAQSNPQIANNEPPVNQLAPNQPPVNNQLNTIQQQLSDLTAQYQQLMRAQGNAQNQGQSQPQSKVAPPQPVPQSPHAQPNSQPQPATSNEIPSLAQAVADMQRGESSTSQSRTAVQSGNSTDQSPGQSNVSPEPATGASNNTNQVSRQPTADQSNQSVVLGSAVIANQQLENRNQPEPAVPQPRPAGPVQPTNAGQPPSNLPFESTAPSSTATTNQVSDFKTLISPYHQGVQTLLKQYLSDFSKELEIPEPVLAPSLVTEFENLWRQRQHAEPLLLKLPEYIQQRSVLLRFADELKQHLE